MVDPLCTQCADAIKDTCYHGPQKRRTYLDPRVHPVPWGLKVKFKVIFFGLKLIMI